MNNGCDLVTLPPFSKQVLASLTKILRKENTIFKMIHLFMAQTDVSLWRYLSLPSLWNKPTVEWPFLTCCGMLKSTLPVSLVLESRLFIWTLYSSVPPLCCICKSREHAFSTLLQIIDTPYCILRRFQYGDPLKPRNCIIFSYLTSHYSCFRGHSGHF